MLGLTAAFGTVELPPAGELRSRPIRLSGASANTGPLVIKLTGTDAKGRRVAAWADLPAGPKTDDY
jgi:hypothetical protein